MLKLETNEVSNLPLSNISLLVRWLQSIHGGPPKYKAKAQPAAGDFTELLDEYRCVSAAPAVLRRELAALTSSREARKATATAADAGVCGRCKSATVAAGGANRAHGGWFHVGCVGLAAVPDVDEWYCESCAAAADDDGVHDDDMDDEEEA